MDDHVERMFENAAQTVREAEAQIKDVLNTIENGSGGLEPIVEATAQLLDPSFLSILDQVQAINAENNRVLEKCNHEFERLVESGARHREEVNSILANTRALMKEIEEDDI